MNIFTKLKIARAANKAYENIEEAYKMNTTKPGWKTTEFWMTILTNVVTVVGALNGVINPNTASIIIAVANGVYGVLRVASKATPTAISSTETVTVKKDSVTNI